MYGTRKRADCQYKQEYNAGLSSVPEIHLLLHAKDASITQSAKQSFRAHWKALEYNVTLLDAHTGGSITLQHRLSQESKRQSDRYSKQLLHQKNK